MFDRLSDNLISILDKPLGAAIVLVFSFLVLLKILM